LRAKDFRRRNGNDEIYVSPYSGKKVLLVSLFKYHDVVRDLVHQAKIASSMKVILYFKFGGAIFVGKSFQFQANIYFDSSKQLLGSGARKVSISDGMGEIVQKFGEPQI